MTQMCLHDLLQRLIKLFLSLSGDESVFVVEIREGLDTIAKDSHNCAIGSMALLKVTGWLWNRVIF